MLCPNPETANKPFSVWYKFIDSKSLSSSSYLNLIHYKDLSVGSNGETSII
jgi:hypothetical protein